MELYNEHDARIRDEQDSWDSEYAKAKEIQDDHFRNGYSPTSWESCGCNCSDCQISIPSRPSNDWSTPRNGRNLLDALVLRPARLREIAGYAKKNDLLTFPASVNFDTHYLSNEWSRLNPPKEESSTCVVQ